MVRHCGAGVNNFTSAKHLGFRKQFGVDFESDDGFVFHLYAFPRAERSEVEACASCYSLFDCGTW